MHGLISICIPVYNGEEYLRECLNSALAQTYPGIEIIIVDDGSTDDSAVILKKYSEKDSRIKIFRNTVNMGLVQNWNRCIGLASGEWIKFLFQDDIMEENCIERFVDYISTTGEKIPVLVSKRKYFSDKPLSERENAYYKSRSAALDKLSTAKGIISPAAISNAGIKNLALNFIGEPTVLMFRKSVTEELGFFNDALDQICDLEFVLRIACMHGLAYIPYELTRFRIHENSTTRRNLGNKYYKLAYLEPVRLAHMLLFDDQYKRFRGQLTSFNLFKLKVYFSVRSYEAYRKAEESSGNMHAFESTLEKFPRMVSAKKKSISRMVIYGFMKLKRKLVN
jgi:glycosyltransferase involved in cell wall biosynthesis